MMRRQIGCTGAAASVVIAMGLGGCSTTGTAGGSYAGWSHFSASPAVMRSDEPVMPYRLDYEAAGPVYVTGQIKEVCQNKGCWFILTDGHREIRVKFKDYAFFVPMNSMGHMAVVEGWGNVNVLDVEWARHLAEESGKSQAEIDAITEPVPTYEIEATSVYISGSGLDAPFEPEEEKEGEEG